MSHVAHLSVLDLIPVYAGQTSAAAVAATVALAQTADRLGFRRYWFAEHHNMASVASTTPPVIAAAVAAKTTNIRVGAGGVMLPNHAPMVVAEQFAMLEAIAPGRIDLGIGRAPGSDPVVTALLRSSGTTSDVDQFPSHIDHILALLSHAGGQLKLADGRDYQVRATPAAASTAAVWLLGSSDYSALLAAQLGLPYVFAHHFSGEGTDRAITAYRENFVPSIYLDAPHTFITVNVSIAADENEARQRALPYLHQMSRLRTSKPLHAVALVEDALDNERDLDAMQRQIIAAMEPQWIIGDAAGARRQIDQLAQRFGAEEVMVSVQSAPRRGEALDRVESRITALELLADVNA